MILLVPRIANMSLCRVHTKVFDFIYHCNHRVIQIDITKAVIHGRWIVWHNVRGQQNTYMSSSYRSNRLDLSHWDPYAVCRGGCLELYYCNMVEWFWWDSSLISTTNWFPSALWHCRFGHLVCKSRPRNEFVEWDLTLHYYYPTTLVNSK